jgi:hypothetical protein
MSDKAVDERWSRQDDKRGSRPSVDRPVVPFTSTIDFEFWDIEFALDTRCLYIPLSWSAFGGPWNAPMEPSQEEQLAIPELLTYG